MLLLGAGCHSVCTVKAQETEKHSKGEALPFVQQISCKEGVEKVKDAAMCLSSRPVRSCTLTGGILHTKTLRYITLLGSKQEAQKETRRAAAAFVPILEKTLGTGGMEYRVMSDLWRKYCLLLTLLDQQRLEMAQRMK